jgi:tetratricopeptide (TPR) repeat protein
LALDAALLTRPFNQDDLDAFTYLPENERTALYNWLVKLPFVRSSQHDGRYSYHNLVQELFSRHLYQRSLKEYNVTRNTLASYYKQLLKKSQTEIGREIYKTAEWLELVLALVSQLFLLSEETSHIAAIEYILNAYRYSDSSKEIVKFLEEITKEKSNSQANADARGCANLLIRYIEANIASREFLEVVNCLLSKVPQEHSSFSELSAYLYVSRGRAYISRREYQLAINDINHAIEIRPNYASAFLHRGQAYRYMNCYEDALNDLEHAINLSEDLVHSGQKEKGNIFLYLKNIKRQLMLL